MIAVESRLNTVIRTMSNVAVYRDSNIESFSEVKLVLTSLFRLWRRDNLFIMTLKCF